MSVKISRILHAGYIFESQDTTLLFDPLFENPFSFNCYAYPPIKFDIHTLQNIKFDAIFISHYHDDHCSFESLNFLDKNTPLYLFCVHEELFQLLQDLGFKNIYSLILNQTVHLGPFRVTTKRALDEDVDSLFHIQTQELNILNVVDSWIDEETFHDLCQISQWDLILWPFQTMREIEVLAPRQAMPSNQKIPDEWKNQLKKLNPKRIVPSSCQFVFESWSWYNQSFFPISYCNFKEQINSLLPSTEVIRLDPGESILLDQNSLRETLPLPWISKINQNVVDYEYDKNRSVPSTAEIAQKIPALNEEQKNKVDTFLKSGLLKRFLDLNPSKDHYFKKTKLWKLTVFDENGFSKSYHYLVNQKTIESINTTNQQPEWTTDAPSAKIFSALEHGESLTSIYIRINDYDFDTKTQSALIETDPLEDPLLRCLFNGDFASYQKAQLRRIQNLNQ